MNHSTALSSIRYHLSSWWKPIVFGLLCLLVYNANFRQIGSGDSLAARYLPLGIWRYGTLKLDRITRWVAHGHPIGKRARRHAASSPVNYFEPDANWIARGRHDHFVSFYPVVAPLLVSPLYLPAIAYLHYHGWQQPEVDRVAELMEKLSASVLAAFASVLIYFLVRRDAGRWGFALALAFAFGTNTWMISSQTLWQHGAAELLIALALLLASSAPNSMRVAALGAVCVAITANRPPDALVAGAIAFWVVWTRRPKVSWLLAGAAIPFAALLLYNVGMIGSLTGGYGSGSKPAMSFFQHSAWDGMAGLLISPTRGLLVFSPFLAFVPLGFIRRLREPDTRILTLALGVAVFAQLLLYARMDWRMGMSWGPRVLTDLLPIFIWMLAPVPLVLNAVGRGALILTMVASTVVQAIGAFWYTGATDLAIDSSMKAAWDWRNTQFIAELRHPHACHELLRATTGSIDNVGSAVANASGGIPTLLKSGTLLEGRALTAGYAPAQVILLIDGITIGSTQKFFSRPNTKGAMHTLSPSRWRIVADINGVPPGKHVLQLVVPVEENIRVVRELPVIVVAPNLSEAASTNGAASASASALDGMARRAASALRYRQSRAGYWLAAFTASPRFESPKPEMNTFLTAMMIDFLSPIAQVQGLDDVVQRARQHLGAQIESNGLVRYHGLPEGPTIGTLGFVITPDADDTALVWRIAGPGAADPRRGLMLQELAPYRDARGLYRTWLAPIERYQSLDPGRDPDPVDATIQMHVYLLLRDLDPPAASVFCDALKQAIGDDALWVYYANAPLIPFLRSAELRQKDCAIPLPTDRLARNPIGQELWSETGRRLVATMTVRPSANDRQAIINLLTRLARSDFAEIRQTPPLLYHNDLTAPVSRYYWSEDFGYALWLRLYHAATRDGSSSPSPSP